MGMGSLGKWGGRREPVHGRGSGFGMISHASGAWAFRVLLVCWLEANWVVGLELSFWAWDKSSRLMDWAVKEFGHLSTRVWPKNENTLDE